MERLIFAIDVGGTNTRIAVFSAVSRKIVHKHLFRTNREATGRQLSDDISAGIGRVTIELGRGPSAISICSCGPVDAVSGRLIHLPLFPNIGEYALLDELQDRLGQRPRIQNDANLAALGEYAFGAGIGSRTLLFFTLSTGIGGGVVIEGRLFTGAFGFAGELGHICVQQNGPLCGCGRRGCLEACASGTALESEAIQALRQGVASTLSPLFLSMRTIRMPDIIEHSRAGDGLALAIMERATTYLAEGLSTYVNVFNPDLIVLGGGVSNAFDVIAPPILRKVRAAAMRPMANQFEMRQALLGDDAGLYGAFLNSEPMTSAERGDELASVHVQGQ